MPFLSLTLTMQTRVQGPAKPTRSSRLVTVTKVLSGGGTGSSQKGDSGASPSIPNCCFFLLGFYTSINRELIEAEMW